MSRGKAMTRRLVLALAIVAFGFASLLSGCESDSVSNFDVSPVGKWKLVASSGGITGGGRSPLPDMTIEFTEDGKVTWYEDGEPVWASSYSTGIEKTIFSLDPVPVIQLSDGFLYAYSFPDSETLVLSMDAYDGFQDVFRRI
jgi:hypothetical protein